MHYFPIQDNESQDIQQYFKKASEIIIQGRTVGGVLVFCYAGVSRSATIVLSYLMGVCKIPLQEAFETVRLKRKICPNKGFWSQLEEYDKQLNKSRVKEDLNY